MKSYSYTKIVTMGYLQESRQRGGRKKKEEGTKVVVDDDKGFWVGDEMRWQYIHNSFYFTFCSFFFFCCAYVVTSGAISDNVGESNDSMLSRHKISLTVSRRVSNTIGFEMQPF